MSLSRGVLYCTEYEMHCRHGVHVSFTGVSLSASTAILPLNVRQDTNVFAVERGGIRMPEFKLFEG